MSRNTVPFSFFLCGEDMGEGLYISKTVAVVCVVAALGAVATIIALSVAYAQETSKIAASSLKVGPTIGPTTPPGPKELWHHYRLPDSLFPELYSLTLWPRLEPNSDGQYIFTGNSSVVFTCMKETDVILIHAQNLKFIPHNGFDARLQGLNGAPAPSLKKTWLEVPTEYLVVQLHSPLQVGSQYELFTEFVGDLSDDLEGFYRSEYTEDGVKRYERFQNYSFFYT